MTAPTPKPQRAGLVELAERCEAATAESQGMLIEQAWDLLAEHSDDFRRFALASPDSGFDNNDAKFGMALEARAYESAAMMLVPEGRSWSVENPANADGSRSVFGYPSRCHARVEGSPNDRDYAKTPALALTAAAIRAALSTLSNNGGE